MSTQRRGSRISQVAALAIGLISTSGCRTLPGDCSALPFREYDERFKAQLKTEVDATPVGSATETYVNDQTNLRDAVRGCKGLKP